MVIRRAVRRIFYNDDGRLDGETVFVVVTLLLISVLGTLYLWGGLYGGMSW